jgi:SPP1 gp7 family putative phage head morphogenesis protein
MASINMEPLPFEEAIRFFRDKLTLTPEQYRALAEDAEAKAFTVSGYTSLEVINDIFRELDKALADGLTVKEFRDSVNGLLAKKGYEGITPYRADNIFRTNVQTAYNVGRYKQQTDPDVLQARPYWIYDAVNDRRTRPAHLAMDGTVRRYDDPFWDTWYPPNGYRCRCGVRTASERDVRRKGLQVQTGPAPAYVQTPVGTGAVPLVPDKGFAYNPGKVAWTPDLSKFPPELREAYQKRNGWDRSNPV